MNPTHARLYHTLTAKVFKDEAMAWFITDDDGIIRDYGGRLDQLDIPAPEEKMRVSDLLIFLEGILPLETEVLDFSMMELPSGVCVDAWVLNRGSSHDILVWDSSQKRRRLAPGLQAVNDLSLMIQAREKELAGLDPQGQHQAFMNAFYRALNFVVLERDDQGRFLLSGPPPDWISCLPQAAQLLEKIPLQGDHYSFLGNFIQEAEARWARGVVTSYNSGLWVEQDAQGEDCLFEATALDVRGKKLLVISKDAILPDEKQSIIQKGRDLALYYDDERRTGRKLRDMNEILELRVAERTRELARVNEQLSIELAERKKAEAERTAALEKLRHSQKMEAIGTMAGGVAHDFNNILSGIIGYTELCRADLGDNPKFQKILNAAYRARNLVKQILTFSHQENQDREPVMLSRVVEEVADLVKGAMPDPVETRCSLRSDAYILADPTEIHQVVMNLCTNAWQAMAEQGGTLSLMLTSHEGGPESPLPDHGTGSYLELIVKDNGPGIPASIMDRIFDPYFTTKAEGNGLGLSVVHGIVRKTGGQIQVASSPGRGTVFKVYFPIWELRST